MLSASTPIATSLMHPMERTDASESRTRLASQRRSPAARMLFGIALLSLTPGSFAGEAARLPAGSETLIDRESLDAPERMAPLAESEHAKQRGAGRPTTIEHGLEAFSPWQLPRLTDPESGGLGSARVAEAGPLADFTLKDILVEESAPREFRPRQHSLLEGSAGLGNEDSLMNDSNTWQRLASEYRVRRRVRVITLWDAGWSSLSLQAGKHGDPYLQWTGHLFGRGEVSHGLLDHWLPTPAASDTANRGVAHALTLPSAAKSPASGVPRIPSALP